MTGTRGRVLRFPLQQRGAPQISELRPCFSSLPPDHSPQMLSPQAQGEEAALPTSIACAPLPSHSDLQSPLFSSVQAADPPHPDFEALSARVHASTGISSVLPLVPTHRHQPGTCLNPFPRLSSSPGPTSVLTQSICNKCLQDY